MNKSEPPTLRESGHLAVLQHAVEDARDRLGQLAPDEWVQELVSEAIGLADVFERWRRAPPTSEERTHIVERVLDLHRNVERAVVERLVG